MPDEAAAERAAILDAALARAGAEGWTWRGVERAARDAGFAAVMARRRFPDGLREVRPAVHALFDSRAAAAADAEALAALPARERIAALVRGRLAVMAPHRAAARRLAAGGPAAAGRALLRTVDGLWIQAGDEATGFDHYTKRALLAAVYGAALLCWFDDDSDGFADTHALLDRRIAGVMRLGKARARLDRACGALDGPLKRVLRAAGARHARRPGGESVTPRPGEAG